MTATHREQYLKKIADIRLMLNLIANETREAEEWKRSEEIDAYDIIELDKIIKQLTEAYGILAADARIETAEALNLANAVVNDAAHRHQQMAHTSLKWRKP